MDHTHDKGTFLLCLAIFIQKITIVFQWTQRIYSLKPQSATSLGAGGYVEDEEKRVSDSGLLCSGAAAATTTTSRKGKAEDNVSMTAQVLSHPVPIDLPDNKHKEDDLPCMSSEYYNIEENRLRSFARWPVPFVSANVLAKYGFFYLGTDDTVKCYFCRVEIGLWEPQDDVIQEHLRWSPYCALLKKRPTNNVPINANYLDAVPEPSYDTCGINIRQHSYAENRYERPSQELERMSGDSWGAASDISLSSSSSGNSHDEPSDMVVVAGGGTSGGGVQQDRASSMTVAEWNSGLFMGEQSAMRRPEYPNYAIEADRFKSYEDWPTSLKQKPKQLSDAGFFYTGKSDRVKCFSCGGGLKDWEQDDEPWQQHAIWYSNCHYLQLMKGPEFIRKCIALKEAATAASEPTADNRASSSASSQPSTSGISSASSSIMSTSPASSSGLSSPSPVGTLEDEDCTLRCGSDVSGGEEAGRDDTGNRKVSDGKICKICFVNEYNTAFMPCGHVVACAKCASSVNKCPLCQQPFINVLRLYLS
ncbi:death-associated inhibitor of apoptosis 1-like [Anopheles ziemanni]|uniref:death-associated inhibitor of apoptosis 1-like n=1 Tax=Anopheles coustani TaxID=139045 RepID=UPI002659AE00|nr:death-associated inhibitor of apoptosis 1-like [Anopheles coustani]XP_058167182.1 death-associated inhibitor of apoptosis 1-like [Anopheles ziemanni]